MNLDLNRYVRSFTNRFIKKIPPYINAIKNSPFFLSDERYILRRFYDTFGYIPDLRKPHTLNEKINWKKLYDHRALLTNTADKFAVRDYVKEKIGDQYLPKFYQVVDDPLDINTSLLPDSYVIKATHGSNWTIIVNEQKHIDWIKIINKTRKWLKTNYYLRGREWCYKHIKPKLLIEEFLDDQSGQALIDYKIFCFHGEPKFFEVHIDRFTDHRKNLYDLDWNFIEVKYNRSIGRQVPKPRELKQMLDIAKSLSNPFDFIRVDLYEVTGRIYFGELTHYPANGFGTFTPKKFDQIFGDFWIMKTPGK